MLALKIIGIIVAVIAAIMLIPVGADIAYEGGSFSLSAKVCGVLLQLFPRPPDEILSLVKKVLKKFGRFNRKFKVDRFLLHYTAAGDDPYNTAVTFGYVNAALSSLAPLCRERFDVKDCDVRTDIDFAKDSMEIDFGLAFSIRIGAFFGLIFGIAFSALGILIRNKLRLLVERIRSGRGDKPGEDKVNDDIVINIDAEKDKENIQAEERMDSNG